MKNSLIKLTSDEESRDHASPIDRIYNQLDTLGKQSQGVDKPPTHASNVDMISDVTIHLVSLDLESVTFDLHVSSWDL